MTKLNECACVLQEFSAFEIANFGCVALNERRECQLTRTL